MHAFHRWAIALVFALASLVTSAAGAATYTSLYVFGDSLSDPGNAAALTGGPAAPFFPPFPPYVSGHFSNGPTAAEYLATKLGVTVSGGWPTAGGANNMAAGGALTGKLAGVTYFGGYLSAEKTRNSTTFVNMATVAGAPADIDSGMWLLGLRAEPLKDLALRFSSYHVPDILNSTFADVAWTTDVSAAYRLRLGAQGMYQTSTGSDALTGSSFSTGVGGIRADLISGAATGTLSYTQTGRGAAYHSPYGSWAGYTSMIIQDFNQANQKALLIGGTYDFAGLSVPGLTLNANIVFGRDSINPSTTAALPNLTEYDLTLDYRFSAKTWPKWAQPLWIRARSAVLVSASAGNTTDYRIILNYPFELK
jgi:hypothetical protein